MQRVLDVGNCDPDHFQMRAFLTTHFACAVDRVMFVDEALRAIAEADYALVLVNRLIFADGSPGMELVRAVAELPTALRPAVMLVSNFAEAQQEAVAAGALRGFGKADLGGEPALQGVGQVLRRLSRGAGGASLRG